MTWRRENGWVKEDRRCRLAPCVGMTRIRFKGLFRISFLETLSPKRTPLRYLVVSLFPASRQHPKAPTWAASLPKKRQIRRLLGSPRKMGIVFNPNSSIHLPEGKKSKVRPEHPSLRTCKAEAIRCQRSKSEPMDSRHTKTILKS